MKKYLSLLTGLLLFAACTDEKDLDQIYLSYSSYTFDAAGGSVEIEVTSNTEWKTDSDASWLTIGDRTAQSVTVTAAANDTGKSRTAVVRFVGGEAPDKEVTFTQQCPAFEGRFVELYATLGQRPVFSRNGIWCAGIVIDGYEADGNTAIKVPVIVNAITGEERRYDPDPNYYAMGAVSDDGRVIAIDYGSAAGSVMIVDGKASKVEVDGYINTRVESVNPDGSVWVGYAYDKPNRTYVPVKWVNGQPEILPVPETSVRGTKLNNGAMARGCSSDGSVIFGSEWDMMGLIYWKNGKLFNTGVEFMETRMVKVENILTGEVMEAPVPAYLKKTAESYGISPNGRYIAASFYDYVTEGNVSTQVTYPAVIDTETNEMHLIHPKDQVMVIAQFADNEGYCYGNSSDFGDGEGYIFDYRTSTAYPIDEWMQNKYGIYVNTNRYILNVSDDGNIVSGWHHERSMIAGKLYYGWFYVTPQGLKKE